MHLETTKGTYPFLTGGGEMGTLTRSYDWAATPLGTPDQWPLSLRTTLGIILHSAFPMFLFWGPDLICFYNDAYRPSLGDNGKHPAVGKPAKAVWPEIWNFIGSLIEQVWNTGQAVWFEDQLVPIYRNGRLEDVYWTFSYSPVYSDDGQINGVFVTCTETTRQVLGQQQLTASREQLRRLIEEAPVAIALFSGPQFIITLTNERVLEFWGRSREEVMNKPLFAALPEASGQGFEALLTDVFTSGQRFVARELPVTLKRNGRLEQTYIDFVYEPFRETDGIISGITVVCVEITEQVLARQRIEESEARFRSLVQESPVATCLFVGPELVLDVANEGMIRFFGRGPAIVGKPVQEVLTGHSGDESAIALLTQVFNTGEPFMARAAPAELTIDGVPGIYYFDINLKPLRNASGVVYAVLETATDVTEQVTGQRRIAESEERYRLLTIDLEQQVRARTEELAALNEELAGANNELAAINEELIASSEETTAANNGLSESINLLRRSNENLEQFAYIASHDLQEPLRKVQQFGDLLLNQYSPELGEGVDYLQRMQSAASRMSTLIRDLLTYSRIATQQEAIDTVPLTDVLTLVLADLDLRIQETGATVTVALLPTIHGDRMQLEQLFQNLLSNALKFRRAEVSPAIDIRSRLIVNSQLPASVKPSRPSALYHCIDVADNGIGFDDKYIDRIFQVFQRLHGKSEFSGTGIGLAICEKVAVNHGGAITASSRPGQGATFSIYLPA